MGAYPLLLGLLLDSATASLPSAPPVPKDQETLYAMRSAREQSIGRIVVSPTGDLILYEWSRPYFWNPSSKGLNQAAAARPMTGLYMVRVPEKWHWFDEPTSEYLFPMLAAGTYYLGDLSPDGEWMSFYELNRDDNSVKAGVAATRSILSATDPRITWFDVTPDPNLLDHPPAWSADGKSLIFPVKGGLARADAATGKAQYCTDCRFPASVQPVQLAKNVDRTDVPEQARLVAASRNGNLTIFKKDTPSDLALYLRKNGKTLPLFENARN